MANGDRAELERLRKLKRLQELEAKATGAPTPEPTPEDPQQASFLEALGEGLRRSQEVAEQSPITRGASRAQELLQKGFDVGGEAVATELAESQLVSPEVAAGVGTGISILPDIGATLAGGGLAQSGRQLLARNLTAKGIGAQIGAAERTAGVTKRLTTTRALKQSLDIGRGDFTDVVNKVDTLLTQGVKLPPQFLSDFRVALKKALNTQAFSKGEPQALLLNVKDKADEAFNLAVPGRAKLAKRFQKAKRREEFVEGAKGAVTKNAKRAAVLAALGGAISLFR